MIFCASCGTPNDDGAFCIGCGARLAVSETPVVPGYPGPVPTAPQPPDRTWIPVVAVVLAVIVACVGGLLIWNQLDKSDDETSSLVSGQSDRSRKSGTTPTAGASAQRSGSPNGAPQRVALCPDGSRVAGTTTCPVDTVAAALAAFGFRSSECVRSTAGAAHTGPVNLTCRGGLIHLGIYKNAQKRLARLQAYGYLAGGCDPRPGGTVMCGPTRNGRWNRTYNDAAGLLIFATVDNGGYDTLNSLTQLSADQVRRGTPVS